MGVEIRYKDVSVDAKDDSTPSTTDKQSFVDLNDLKQNDLTFNKYATLEHNFWLLNGTFENFPSDTSEVKFGLWSNSISDEDGLFLTPLQFTIDFSSYVTSVGITFQFNVATEDYCNSLNIKWYQDEVLLEDENFNPNSTLYFCEKAVENYNKLVITFNSTNNPKRYLKLQAIEYGIIRVFKSDELRNTKILEEMSHVSDQVSINTLDFILDSKNSTEYIFQKRQGLEVRFSGDLMGIFFIDKAKRISQRQYEIESVDLMGLLDKLYFDGGTYSNVLVSTLIASIMGDFNYELDVDLGNKTLSGTLPRCTRREALLQVVFAIIGVIDTSRTNKIIINKLSSIIQSTIDESNIYIGSTFETGDVVTGVQVIRNDGVIVSKLNPIVPIGTPENVLEFEGVFIDSTNAQDIVDNLYDYYVTNKNNTSNIKFIVTDEKVGDVVEYATEYLGTKKGRIISMNYGLNSNSIVADVVLKDLEV